MYGTTTKRLGSLIFITLFCFPLLLSMLFFLLGKIDFHTTLLAMRIRDERVMKLIAENERLLKEDRYGGETPEESMQLFTAALQNNDVELASKYFDLSQQKKQRSRLKKYQEGNFINELVYDLKHNLKEVKPLYIDSHRYILYDKQGRETGIFDVSKNINGLWKLTAVL